MKIIVLLVLIFLLNMGQSQPEYVTTIFPFGEILNSLVKGRGKVTVILPPGASPHTYELKPSELRYIENSLALFYGASNLDNWVEKISSLLLIY
jgi:zinc transport system substrate-binding protein